jgi:hypothetical protein
MTDFASQMHTYNIHTTFQQLLLDKLKTDNPLFNLVLTALVILFISNINSIVSKIWNYVCHLIKIVYDKLVHLYNLLFPKKTITKTISIKSITENKQVNELYKAVYWYITTTTTIDYIKEPILDMAFDKKIDIFSPEFDIQIAKTVPQYIERSFDYDNHKITYSFSRNLITIYGDEERKRENNLITLSTTINTSMAKSDPMEDFCVHCVQKYTDHLTKKKWVQQIFVNKDGKWISKDSNNHRKIETVVLKPQIKKEMGLDLDFFLHNEQWYHDIDFPYSRGYLFYGYPGTGKTSMIKAISNYTKRHIHYLLLNEIKSDNELLSVLQDIKYRETILVIEDIDCMTNIIKDRNKKSSDTTLQKDVDGIKQLLKQSSIFNPGMLVGASHGHFMSDPMSMGIPDIMEMNHMHPHHQFPNQYNPLKSSKTAESGLHLTLSGLLNALDGVFNHEGRILIITTNKPKELDKALIRPGRIDRSFLFDYCDKEQIASIYKMFYKKDCPEADLINVPDYKYSPSHITGLFMRYHLDPQLAFQNIDSYDLVELEEMDGLDSDSDLASEKSVE